MTPKFYTRYSRQSRMNCGFFVAVTSVTDQSIFLSAHLAICSSFHLLVGVAGTFDEEMNRWTVGEMNRWKDGRMER
jgi:hypothetical protein